MLAGQKAQQIEESTLEDAYNEAHIQLLRTSLKRSALLVFVLYPAFGIVDWLSYSEHLGPLLIIRVVVCACILLALLAAKRIPARAVSLIGLAAALIAAFGIILMTYIVGGASSPYYAGINLTIVFFATAVPWTSYESLLTSVISIVAYIIACYLYFLHNDPPSGYWAHLALNLPFLLGTAILCVYATFVQTQQRKENFRLNFALGSQNEELTQTIDALGQAQTQLIHSEKLNALGSLSAGLLHEINNPLNFSMTALHMIKLEEVYATDSEFAETVDDIGEGMDRIQTIVGDLKAFAYPSDADKQTAFSIKTAIESALRFTSTERDGIALKEDLACADSVIGSHSHIVQILINLITNATRAIRAQGTDHHGLLRISTHCEDGTMWVAVRDNGIGMDQETQRRIFEPFFTTRVVGEGVGMGLSICHTIMENHEGALEVESKLGEGTVFTFALKTQTD